MVTFKKGKIEVCKNQLTANDPPKIILTKPICQDNRDHIALSHSYRYTFDVMVLFPVM
jgi:hypothetical protein